MEISEAKEVDQNEAAQAMKSSLTIVQKTADRAPYEIALSMDHILEKIFSSSKKKDLLSFRFVSRQWNFCARKQLQKQARMYLTSTEDLERFKSLLEDQSYLHSAFPSSKFKFSNPCRDENKDQDKYFTRHISSGCESSLSLGDALIQDILNLHGAQIRVLHLDLSHDCKDRSHYVQHSEMKFIKDIKNLLLNQAPNLTFLKIKTDFGFRPDSMMYFNNNSNNGQRINEAALKCKSGSNEQQVHNFKAVNRKLQVLHLQDSRKELSVSQNILENILQLAPNVNQIIPSDFCDYSYYLRPRNILPYLQKIQIPQHNWAGTLSLSGVETLEQIAAACEEGDVKFRGITLYSHKKYFSCLESESNNSIIQERTVNVVNRILEWSWDTLETIEWDEFTFWAGLSFPPTMPKVWKISIFHPHDFPNKGKGKGQGQCLFPQNCRWSETFPNVRTVLIYSMTWKVSLMDFINSLTEEPVRSVRKIEIAGLMYSKAEQVSREHLRQLKILFPCAHISY